MSSRYVLIFIVLVLTLESALAIQRSVIKVYGKRTVADRRIQRKYIDMQGLLLRTIKLRETYHGDRRSVITQVRVTRNSIEPLGTNVKLINGGVGYRYVTLQFKSRISEGINVVITIYGKRYLG